MTQSVTKTAAHKVVKSVILCNSNTMQHFASSVLDYQLEAEGQ
jgi:hypothetical protein